MHVIYTHGLIPYDFGICKCHMHMTYLHNCFERASGWHGAVAGGTASNSMRNKYITFVIRALHSVHMHVDIGAPHDLVSCVDEHT